MSNLDLSSKTLKAIDWVIGESPSPEYFLSTIAAASDKFELNDEEFNDLWDESAFSLNGG